jgi:hypothetical protein
VYYSDVTVSADEYGGGTGRGGAIVANASGTWTGERLGKAENILERFSDVVQHPDEGLSPYREFSMDDKTYYFTPGGFLYRKDPDTEALGGFFCGYLTDEVWHYRTADG